MCVCVYVCVCLWLLFVRECVNMFMCLYVFFSEGNIFRVCFDCLSACLCMFVSVTVLCV